MTSLFENGFTSFHVMIIASVCFAVVLVELAFLVFSPEGFNKKRINRRMAIIKNNSNLTQKQVLLKLRKERGLDATANKFLTTLRLDTLMRRSGIRIKRSSLLLGFAMYAFSISAFVYVSSGSLLVTLALFPFCVLAPPFIVLTVLARRKSRKFSEQLPEAIDLITRSLKAGHPTTVAISMVAKEIPDPIGSEFGIMSDEITYGSDLATALQSMYERVGLAELPLLIASVAIQSSTGGNLREILEGLSQALRERGKMKRKIHAISAEGRTSALFLSVLPLILFIALQILIPNYYDGLWDRTITWICFIAMGGWLFFGNLVIYKLISFKF